MLRRVLFVLSLFMLSSTVLASSINRVIYITLDGVRWQDLYLTKDYFPLVWSKHAAHLKFYGAPNSGTASTVASIPISLPSYHSQTSGAVQACDGNECGRIAVETFLEALIRSQHWLKKDVATFSSWDKIELAVEHEEGTTFTNSGNKPVVDPESHEADSVMALINEQQDADQPGSGTRYDKYTFAQALHYFTRYQPRFLWISLNDADELAHEEQLEEYQHSLLAYDRYLDTLFTRLNDLDLDQQTMVIVTTDHGRGDGADWTSHGVEYPGSEHTWAFVLNGALVADREMDGVRYYSTLSIRPSVESVFRIA